MTDRPTAHRPTHSTTVTDATKQGRGARPGPVAPLCLRPAHNSSYVAFYQHESRSTPRVVYQAQGALDRGTGRATPALTALLCVDEGCVGAVADLSTDTSYAEFVKILIRVVGVGGAES